MKKPERDTKYWLNQITEKQVLYDTLFDLKKWPLYILILAALLILYYW
ncbi:hypothetical protein [Pedobacter ginsengisoli]|nr:hypothetical protein [Pedobacter ginsengisoli]